jgi:hypothetical protein
MKALNLELQPLKGLKLSLPQLDKKIKKLHTITRHLSEHGTLDARDQFAELRESLKQCRKVEGNFVEFTKFRRRESRLLSLYVMDLGAKTSRDLLPVFDEDVGISILGNGLLKKHRRTQATQLFFTHYGIDRIPAIDWLARRLKDSWSVKDDRPLFDAQSKIYQHHAKLLFVPGAPAEVAKRYKAGESFEQFAANYGIPLNGEFRERLLEEVILERVRKAPSEGTGEELDRLVQENKERRVRSGNPLGAEAVRILVDRSISAHEGKLPDAWKEKIVAYSCDPRVPNPLDQSLWWSWANRTQKDVAMRALTELTLRQFISLLEESLRGTTAQDQFQKRADMLLRIFEMGKVIDARLVLNENTYRSLPVKFRQTLMPYQTSGSQQHTSFVALKCTNDVFLIEGTHSFALRGFVGADRFPVPKLWSSKTGTRFHDRNFRVDSSSCDIHQVHHVGDWLGDFKNKLRQHHIEWRGL